MTSPLNPSLFSSCFPVYQSKSEFVTLSFLLSVHTRTEVVIKVCKLRFHSLGKRVAVWLVAPPRHLEPGQNDLEPWIAEHVCNFSRQMHYKIHKHSMPFSHMSTFAALALIHASCLTLTRLKIDAGVSASLSGYNYGTTVEL